jgi:hypothetical protein
LKKSTSSGFESAIFQFVTSESTNFATTCPINARIVSQIKKTKQKIREHVKEKIDELATNTKSEKIRDLYGGIN